VGAWRSAGSAAAAAQSHLGAAGAPLAPRPATLAPPSRPPSPQLSTKFSNHVLDATKAYKKLITSKDEVDGLPATALGLAAQQAKGAGHEGATAEEGPWLFTLDFPSY
jgi:hypothetical protein